MLIGFIVIIAGIIAILSVILKISFQVCFRLRILSIKLIFFVYLAEYVLKVRYIMATKSVSNKFIAMVN